MDEEYKYQTFQFTQLMLMIDFTGIFSERFRDMLVRFYQQENIREVLYITINAVYAYSFFTDDFKQMVVNALCDLIKYREDHGLIPKLEKEP